MKNGRKDFTGTYFAAIENLNESRERKKKKGGGGGGGGERERERGGGERENSNSKTLFSKDCFLGSFRPVQQLVFAKLLIKRERERETGGAVVFLSLDSLKNIKRGPELCGSRGNAG